MFHFIFILKFYLDEIGESQELVEKFDDLQNFEKNAKYHQLSATVRQSREETKQKRKEVEKREKEVEEREENMKKWFKQQEEQKKKWAEACPTTVELFSSVYSL